MRVRETVLQHILCEAKATCRIGKDALNARGMQARIKCRASCRTEGCAPWPFARACVRRPQPDHLAGLNRGPDDGLLALKPGSHSKSGRIWLSMLEKSANGQVRRTSPPWSGARCAPGHPGFLFMSRRAPMRMRRALSLMKPPASRWS